MKIKTTPTPLVALIIAGITLFPLVGVTKLELIDSSCLAEAKKADDGTCGAAYSADIKACMQQSLSKSCANQYQSIRVSAPDPACKKEIEGAAMPCVQSGKSKGEKCFLSRLSPTCQEQARTANDRLQKMIKACNDVTQRLCGKVSPIEKQFQCRKDHQTEIAAACPD